MTLGPNPADDARGHRFRLFFFPAKQFVVFASDWTHIGFVRTTNGQLHFILRKQCSLVRTVNIIVSCFSYFS